MAINHNKYYILLLSIFNFFNKNIFPDSTKIYAFNILANKYGYYITHHLIQDSFFFNYFQKISYLFLTF